MDPLWNAMLLGGVKDGERYVRASGRAQEEKRTVMLTLSVLPVPAGARVRAQLPRIRRPPRNNLHLPDPRLRLRVPHGSTALTGSVRKTSSAGEEWGAGGWVDE